jgi:hypothetical protein
LSQLEFAIKYDGINLAILLDIFLAIDEDELIAYIKTKPTGKYTRKIWFLYEFLLNKPLPIEDLKQGNYVELLESDKYYTLKNAINLKRYRIKNNLLGTRDFCPIVRKSQILKEIDTKALSKECENLIVDYPSIVLKRVLSYLYTKETKSSFSIEKEKPNSSRTQKFISLLYEAQKEDFCTKEKLIELQHKIVDSRFANFDYRTEQNYVGESVFFGQEKDVAYNLILIVSNVVSGILGMITGHKIDQIIKKNRSS